MYEQALRLAYTSPYGTVSEVTVELAGALARLTPGDLSASFFCSSGSEAVEASFTLAHHQATGNGRRYKVVSLRRAYHGATTGALSATGWSPGFGIFRSAADPRRPSGGVRERHAALLPPVRARPDVPRLRARLCQDHRAGNPRQRPGAGVLRHRRTGHGHGRLHRPAMGYLAQVREICSRYGILLIADEVVCGFGRTGRWFGVNHAEVVPDILVVAKGLTSGYAPMAAAVVRREIAEALPVFLDVHTYGGHPVSAAAAVTNLAIIEREGLVENAATVGAHLVGLLEGLRAHPMVADVRGLGLIAAVELTSGDPGHADVPLGAGVDDQVAATAFEQGLFVRPLGGTILVAPPLIFTPAQAERAAEVLDLALSRVEEQIPPGPTPGAP